MLTVLKPGRMGYDEACRLQMETVNKRITGKTGDTLILLEHPPVIIKGRSASDGNILRDRKKLLYEGIPVLDSSRGGDVTVHAPGQVIGYPVIRLKEGGRDLHRYLHNLEEVIIRTLANYGIIAGRYEGRTGVWLGRVKIASIGVAVRKWVAYHGFALNANTDLRYFSYINPCGFKGLEMTSVSKLTGRETDIEELHNYIIKAFREVFRF